MAQKFETMKKSLEIAFQGEREKLAAAAATQLQEQLEGLLKKHKEEFERQRVELRKQVEAELSQKFQATLEQERKRITQEATQAIEAEKKRHAAERDALIKAENGKIQKVRADLRQEMEGNFLARLERVAEEYDNKMTLLGAQVPEKQEDRLKLHRTRMRSCYTDGAPSVDAARMLMQLKELLELSFDDHLAIESDIRMEHYAHAIERKIASGEIGSQNKEAIEKLKAQYSLSEEEEANLEPYILSCFQRSSSRGRILVADDDKLLLRAVEDLLTGAGFQVITALDVPEALNKLKNAPVDLILSDIRFHDSDMDGFKFFKSVQAQSKLRNIPFVFMSSLTDGAIIQSGVQLGVDDYLTKPIDDDLMIAVIDGKLKRYRSFRQD